MPIDPDWSPDFRTPNQIEAQRAMAKALLDQSLTTPTGHSGNVTAVSPWGGVAQLANALVGTRLMHQAGEAELGSNVAGARSAPSYEPNGSYGRTSDASDPMGSYSAATSKLESGGNYHAIGPVTSRGDHAYGKYQVLGKNIAPWTHETLGYTMTPQEFLTNPEAQEAVYKKKFGEYVQAYGPEGAARAWYGGPENVNNPNARDLIHPNAPTVGQYGQNFSNNLKFAANQAPVAYGAGAATDAPAPGAASSPPPAAEASPAGPTMAAGGATSGLPPVPSMGSPRTAPGPGFGPAYAPYRIPVTREQFERTMANPYVSPEMKKFTAESYYSQGQPLSTQGPYGSTLIFSGQDRNRPPIVMPGAPDKSTVKIGPIERPTYTGVMPPGSSFPPPSTYRINPTAPGSSGGGATEPVPTPLPGSRSDLEGGPKLAALETGTMSDAPPLGMLGTKPPEGGVKLAGPPTGSGAGPKSLDDMSDEELYKWNQGQEIYKQGQEAANTKAADSAQKYFDTVTEKSSVAADRRAQLDEMERTMSQPGFYSGIGSPWVLAAKRMIAAVGGDPNSAASMEVFDKLRNSLNLSGLREDLGGLGQIRLAEIQMVNSAFANLDNSVAANKALVFLAQKINDRVTEAGLVLEKRRMENGGIPSLGDKKALIDMYKNKPLMTDEEIAHFQDMIRSETKGKVKSDGIGPPLSTPPPDPNNLGPERPKGSKPAQ